MLSRVAECLYWMSRYLERAEYVARLMDVTLHQMLDQTPTSAGRRWERLLASLRQPDLVGCTPYEVTRALTCDASRSGSIISCIAVARENARQVREEINSEMWEHLNRLYLTVAATTIDEIWRLEPHEFFVTVKEGAHLFQGITDGTMRHDQGWRFIQAGRCIERASATATLLDVHFNPGFFVAADDTQTSPLDYLEWIALLKFCTAFEAYCRVYTADIRANLILDFLLLNPEFPHSVRFCVTTAQSALQGVSRSAGLRSPSRAERMAGRLRATLDYGVVDEILDGDLHGYLESIGAQCGQVHAAIYDTYVRPRTFPDQPGTEPARRAAPRHEHALAAANDGDPGLDVSAAYIEDQQQ